MPDNTPHQHEGQLNLYCNHRQQRSCLSVIQTGDDNVLFVNAPVHTKVRAADIVAVFLAKDLLRRGQLSVQLVANEINIKIEV
jgi:hypothetical protein